MTKLSTRQSEVEKLEGFKINIFDGKGAIADPSTQGIPDYDFKRKLAGSDTVVGFRNRFESAYPGYTCEVLDGTGAVAHGNTQLKTVRKTY
ncbi:hypothetical protein [Variovorax sp. UC122_21]|uniref:hypothetical protein n=1 Tax=Variovorax sp. UC122_21 TaxID=3374554 RepID=UPI0037580F59